MVAPQKDRNQVLVARRSKYRFVIFDRGAPKMGKKSRRETIGVKVRSESKFSILTHLVRCARVATLQSAQCHRATSVFRIRCGTLRHWCIKFLPRIFYPFWSPHNRKLRIGLFDRRATKIYDRTF